MSMFKNICETDKPRERLLINGAKSLSNEELLAIIIKTGTKKYSVKEVASLILNNINSISEMDNMSINKLISIEGIGKVKAIEIKAAIELGRRVYYNNLNKIDISFTKAEDIYNYFKYEFVNKKQEYFYCVYVDTKKKLIEKKCLFIGTINMSLVSVREIFKEALLLSASGIFCVHNHPSGDACPSNQDKLLTNKIKELGVLHEIPLFDHIIIGDNKFYSFFNNKIFEC